MSSSTDRLRVVAVLILNERNEVLAVSRKTDHNDLGLPGGKVELGETFVQAAVRETWEEIGILISKMREVFDHPDREQDARTFLVEEWEGMIFSAEGAWVGWVAPARLLEGSFREYNRALFEHLGML